MAEQCAIAVLSACGLTQLPRTALGPVCSGPGHMSCLREAFAEPCVFLFHQPPNQWCEIVVLVCRQQ